MTVQNEEIKRFPMKDEFVLNLYKDEILLRAEWTEHYLQEGHSAEEPLSKIQSYSTAINYGMSIYRLLYWHTTKKNSEGREIAKQRAKAIKDRWPNIPRSPKTLREVRNRLEHFEERMDQWAVSDPFKIFIDSNEGFEPGMIAIDGVNETQSFRSLDSKGNFVVLGEKVNLQEINNWCKELKSYFNSN